MRVVVQRVKSAFVTVDEKTVGKIKSGMVVFLGMKEGDGEKEALYLINKLVHMRIFSDENDKMNLSLKDVNGEILVVSQFTLYGELSGRRPSFTNALNAALAKPLYEKFIFALQKEIKTVQSGVFQAKMEVSLINDGPVTFVIDAP